MSECGGLGIHLVEISESLRTIAMFAAAIGVMYLLNSLRARSYKG